MPQTFPNRVAMLITETNIFSSVSGLMSAFLRDFTQLRNQLANVVEALEELMRTVSAPKEAARNLASRVQGMIDNIMVQGNQGWGRQREELQRRQRPSQSTSIWRHRSKGCWWSWQEWSQESEAAAGSGRSGRERRRPGGLSRGRSSSRWSWRSRSQGGLPHEWQDPGKNSSIGWA